MAAWSGASRGGYWGSLFFVTAVRWFGRWPAYAVAWFVAGSFLVLAPAARRASQGYLARVGVAPTLPNVWRHLFAFASCLVDRLVHANQGDAAFNLVSEGLEAIVPGTLLVTAHTGDWELAGRMLNDRLGHRLTIVVRDAEAADVRRALAKVAAVNRPEVLVADGMVALAIVRALRAGRVVAVQGDRCVDDRMLRVDFLGDPAAFPLGPWLVAASARCPVVLAFGAKTDLTTYRFRAVRFELPPGRASESAGPAAAAYASALAAWVREHPLQWFNFYDFWLVPEPTPNVQALSSELP